jgi:LacI family gluconate utilization system Gnt-I transcriptional repressor
VHALAGAGSFRDGMAALDAIRAALPGCDAIFFGSDILAAGALARAAERGIAVPAGLAIAGYGDLDFAAHTAPPLTSIRASDYDTGRLAGEMLRDRLDGRAPPEPVIQVPMTLVVRGSTAAA